MAIPLTFGNPLKFGPGSCHNTKGIPTFLHREREHLKLHVNTQQPSRGARARGSCHHSGWLNEGPRRWRFFLCPDRGRASTGWSYDHRESYIAPPLLLDNNSCKINEMLNRHINFHIAIETFIIDLFICLQLIFNFQLIEPSNERNLNNHPCSNEQHKITIHLMATYVPLRFPLALQDMCSL